MTSRRHDGTTERVVAHLRLPVDLHARLVAFAQRTERSANGAAVHALRTFLDDQDRTAATR